MSSRTQRSIPLGGRYRQVSLYSRPYSRPVVSEIVFSLHKSSNSMNRWHAMQTASNESTLWCAMSLYDRYHTSGGYCVGALSLNENMTWNFSIRRISSKISRVVGIMNPLKHVLPHSVIKLMYYSQINSHLQLHTTDWGLTNRSLVNNVVCQI